MPNVILPGGEVSNIRTKELLLKAAEALDPLHRSGFTEYQMSDWIDAHYPREDTRSWADLTVAADYAVWADNGEFCSTADNRSSHPKFLERVSVRGEYQNLKYRLKLDRDPLR